MSAREESKKSNEKVVAEIMQNIASRNIQNPYYSRIKSVLDEMVEDSDRRFARELVLGV